MDEYMNEWKGKTVQRRKGNQKKGCQYKCPTSFTNKHFQVETRAVERQANVERERERERGEEEEEEEVLKRK